MAEARQDEFRLLTLLSLMKWLRVTRVPPPELTGTAPGSTTGTVTPHRPPLTLGPFRNEDLWSTEGDRSGLGYFLLGSLLIY
ncbi:hypothetical protein TNCV_1404701 [Trichonephila clavipes]|nr:hypothetical protein TNCV_1404701 [Trichonephila clavipes]